MLKLILRRVLWSIPLLLVASLLTFVLVSLIPGNPAQAILGVTATPAQVAALQKQLGLDQSLWAQYWHWLTHALGGDLGSSLITGQAVTSYLGQRLSATLDLIVGGTLVAAALGLILGVLAATRGGWTGRLVQLGAVLGLAVPNFWLALLLIELFAVVIAVLPATGYVPFTQSSGLWLRSLVLPVTAIAAGATTFIAVQTRDAMLEAFRRDFVRVLAANGIPRRSVVWRHALRNAAIPVVTSIGVTFVGLFGGTVLVESVFAIPGLGSGLATAASQHDIPVIQGTVVCFTLIVVVVNLLVDIAYGFLDPRVRVS